MAARPDPEPAALRHRAEAAALAMPPLLIAAERVASAVVQGTHGRRRTGTGETFWQFRQYQPGDPASRIDWRESAKSRHVYVRETEWEAAQSVFLWRDASESMDYASNASLPTKRQRADLLTLALAALLVRGGERVTLMGSGLAPGTGRAVLDQLALLLDRGGAAGSLPGIENLPRHGQVVWLGDFLSSLEAIDALVLHYAGRGVKGHLLQLLDPAEETLPFTGRIRFEEIEDEPGLMIGRVETIRAEYAARLASHRAGLAALTRLAGWTFGIHRTDSPPHYALLGLYRVLTES
jgi:uncharacterized protein (DUF58 family)